MIYAVIYEVIYEVGELVQANTGEWKIGDECWATSPFSRYPAGEPRFGVIAEVAAERISVRFSDDCVSHYYDDTFHRLSRVAPPPVCEVLLIEKVPPSDPLDAVISPGDTLRALLAVDRFNQREADDCPIRLTAIQRVAVSSHRSAEFRALVAAGPSVDAARWRKDQQPSVWLDCAEDM